MDVIGRIGFGADFGALKRALGSSGSSAAIDPGDAFQARGAAAPLAAARRRT